MFNKLLTNATFALNKKSAKDHAEYFAGSLQMMKREVTKPGTSFIESLLQEGISEPEFHTIWAKESVLAYIKRYPATSQRQIDFLSRSIEPNLNWLSPSVIPDVIIKYGCSNFDSLCEALREKGDERGTAWIMMMHNIIEDVFQNKGFKELIRP